MQVVSDIHGNDHLYSKTGKKKGEMQTPRTLVETVRTLGCRTLGCWSNAHTLTHTLQAGFGHHGLGR
jgi:hypothetical protein